MLTNLGYLVVGEVGDGRSAVNLARELRPDIVIMDIKMPDMDGIEAAKVLYRGTDCAGAPAQRLQPAGTLATRAADRRGGYLVKPFRESDLTPAISGAGPLQRVPHHGRRSTACGMRWTRKAVDRAKGILMDTQGLNETGAFRRIQKMSMNNRKPMRAPWRKRSSWRIRSASNSKVPGTAACGGGLGRRQVYRETFDRDAVYNERATLEEIVRLVRTVDRRSTRRRQPHPGRPDCRGTRNSSSSTTARLTARDILAQWKKDPPPDMHIVFHEVNGGKGALPAPASRHATGDLIVIQDADLGYDPRDYVSCWSRFWRARAGGLRQPLPGRAARRHEPEPHRRQQDAHHRDQYFLRHLALRHGNVLQMLPPRCLAGVPLRSCRFGSSRN